MRSLLAGILLLFAIPAAAADATVTVQQLSVALPGHEIRVAEAQLNRQWFLSWGSAERRDVILQPLNPNGQRLPARTFTGCVVGRNSGVENNDVIRTLSLNCQH